MLRPWSPLRKPSPTDELQTELDRWRTARHWWQRRRLRRTWRGRAFVSPDWLPVILVVVGVIVLAVLAYSILGWTGMR